MVGFRSPILWFAFYNCFIYCFSFSAFFFSFLLLKLLFKITCWLFELPGKHKNVQTFRQLHSSPMLVRSCFSSVQLLSRVWLFATPWIAACQASLSITNSQSSPKLMSIELVMPSSHLILCHPLLLLPPIPPRITLFQWVNSSHVVAKVLEFQL